MDKNIYLDHSIIGLIYEHERGKFSGGLPDKQQNTEALLKLLKIASLVFFVAEDSISENERKKWSDRVSFLTIASRFKYLSLQHRIPLDGTYRYGHGVTFGGRNLEKIKELYEFLKSRLPKENTLSLDYDCRELSNCYENGIDYFLTIDNRTILAFNSEIKTKFGINVISPKKLLDILNH